MNLFTTGGYADKSAVADGTATAFTERTTPLSKSKPFLIGQEPFYFLFTIGGYVQNKGGYVQIWIDPFNFMPLNWVIPRN